MPNELDETNGPISPEGRDVHVIQKQIPVTVGTGSKVFEILLWVCLVIPGLVFLFKKIKAKNHLEQMQQRIQTCASQIDNYLEQRVRILDNAAQLVNKAVNLDKTVFENVAKYRGGARFADNDAARGEAINNIESVGRSINVALEAYPDIKAHAEIEDAMQQNSYLQKEITAAREVYNDAVLSWNTKIFVWPTYRIVAAKAGYTTRIPFTASAEVKERARGTFFGD